MLDREIRRLTRLSVHGQATDVDRQRLEHLQAAKQHAMKPTFKQLLRLTVRGRVLKAMEARDG